MLSSALLVAKKDRIVVFVVRFSCASLQIQDQHCCTERGMPVDGPVREHTPSKLKTHSENGLIIYRIK